MLRSKFFTAQKICDAPLQNRGTRRERIVPKSRVQRFVGKEHSDYIGAISNPKFDFVFC